MSPQAMQAGIVVGNSISIGVLLGWIVGFLGPVATLFTIVWVLMQIVINWEKFKTALKKLVGRV